MELEMVALLLILVTSLLNIASATDHDPSPSGDKDCDLTLRMEALAKQQADTLFARVSSGQARLGLEAITIELMPYLESQILVQSLTEKNPKRPSRAMRNARSARLERIQAQHLPIGTFPVSKFAIGAQARVTAMVFHAANFDLKRQDEDRANDVFVAQIDKPESQLKHYARLALPDKKTAKGLFFSRDEKRLFIQTSKAMKNFGSDEDLIAYDLSAPVPKQEFSLAKQLDVSIKEVVQLTSPDQDLLYYFLELSDPVTGRSSSEMMLVSLQPSTRLAEVLVRSKAPPGVFSDISQSKFEDDRAGHLVREGQQVRFIHRERTHVFYQGRFLESFQSPEISDAHRSGKASWLYVFNKVANGILLWDQSAGENYYFTAPGLAIGNATPVSGGFIYEEFDHPHYRTFYLDSSNQQSQALASERLFHSRKGRRFLAGLTGDKRKGTQLQIHFF